MSMTPQRWQRLQRLFDQAIDLEPEARARLVVLECDDDVPLRDQLLSLLRASRDDLQFEQRVETAIASLVHATTDFQPGQVIGRFRIERMLGRGGMGAVYLASRADEEFEHRVAIKTVGDTLLSNRIVARLRSERQILANLNHPNIARLLDGGATPEGTPYLVMEYVDGRRIDEYCRGQQLGLRQRLELFQQVCAATQYAHQQLIIHRDIKPNNILVTADGVVKLLDFGIAKLVDPATVLDPGLTRVHERILTPDHASPEQMRGEAVGTASDIYALGVLLYELLAEHKPFDFTGQSLEQIERTICQQSPAKPSERAGKSVLKGDLDTIVLKAMHKEPSRRYPSASTLSDDIENFLSRRPVAARPDSLAYRTRKFVERNSWAVSSSAAVLIAIVVLTIFYTARLSSARDVAEQEARRARFVSDYLVDMLRSASPDVSQGKTITAIDLLHKGEQALESRIAQHPEVQTELLEVMADSYFALGDNQAAKRLLIRAAALRKAFGSSGALAYAHVLASLGQVKSELDDFDGANADLEAAWRLQNLDPHTPPLERARTLLMLAHNYFERNDFNQALTHIEQSRLIVEQAHARSSVIGADAAALLASLRSEQTDYPRAESLLREVIATREQLLGRLHPNTIDAREQLAVVVRRAGHFEAARVMLAQIVADKRVVLGPDHPDVGAALSLLGSVEAQLGHYERAEIAIREALRITHDRMGPTSSQYGSALRTMANNELARGDFAKAEQLFRRAIDIKSLTLPAEDQELQRERMLLSATLREQSRFAAADQLMDPVIRFFEAHDDGKTVQGSVWFEAGRLRLLENRIADARQYLLRGAAGHRAAHDELHPNNIYLLTTLAQLQLQEREFSAAAATSRKALDFALQSIPDSQVWVASLQSIHGAALHFLGEQRGSDMVAKSYEVIARLRPASDLMRQQAKQRLEWVLQPAPNARFTPN
jgi:serine/threonine-protein kinase